MKTFHYKKDVYSEYVYIISSNRQFLRYQLFWDGGTFCILLNTCVGARCNHIPSTGYVNKDKSHKNVNCLYQPLEYI